VNLSTNVPSYPPATFDGRYKCRSGDCHVVELGINTLLIIIDRDIAGNVEVVVHSGPEC
jgi:hypothetical protein